MIGADITASTLEELGIQNVKMHFLCFLPVFELTSSQWKLVTNYVLEWMGLNFYYYDGLQPKMSTGIINEHECIFFGSLDKTVFWCYLTQSSLAFSAALKSIMYCI